MDINEINGLTEKERYEYLIQNTVGRKEIWLLQDEDSSFAMFEDGMGNSYIPVWPEKILSQAHAIDDWEGYVPERMGIGEFLEWLEELKEDQILIGAIPDMNMHALSVDPIEFKNQLIKAAKK
jgi:hypothetical protein